MRLIFYQNQLVKYAFLIEIPKKAGNKMLSQSFWKTKLLFYENKLVKHAMVLLLW